MKIQSVTIGFLMLACTATSAFSAESGSTFRYDGQTREEFRKNMKESAQEMRRFSEDFQRFIADIKDAVRDTGLDQVGVNQHHAIGAVDIEETDEYMTVWVDLPGVDKDELSVQLLGPETLSIRANRTSGTDEATVQERFKGEISREVRLPFLADTSKAIKAKLKNGVLSVIIPKAEPIQGKIVDIRVD